MSRHFEITIKVAYDETGLFRDGVEGAIIRNIEAHMGSAHLLENLDGRVVKVNQPVEIQVKETTAE
jgi:hypothetical protein